MIELYPETEPYEQGFLEVDHGNHLIRGHDRTTPGN